MTDLSQLAEAAASTIADCVVVDGSGSRAPACHGARVVAVRVDDTVRSGEVIVASARAKAPVTRGGGAFLLAALHGHGVAARAADRDQEPAALPQVRVDELMRALDGTSDGPTIVIGVPSTPSVERSVVDAMNEWAASRRARTVVLASPRSSCAGVNRAVEIVERALQRFGPPVHVRKQIVHNDHVVARLEDMGAVFVNEVTEVPRGAVVVFSAHGVSPAVRRLADDRQLVVIDATCPLVAKVHSEVRDHAARGRTIAFIGHAGHEETEGTIGEAPDATRLVQSPADVRALDIDDPHSVAYVTQTTLALDEASDMVAELKRRFPHASGPRGDDICYATSNRQEAVREIAPRCDLVLVVGSPMSSNARRLVEVVRADGGHAELVPDATHVSPGWLSGAGTIGVTSAASTPDELVHDLVAALADLGPIDVHQPRGVDERMSFTLPPEVRDHKEA